MNRKGKEGRINDWNDEESNGKARVKRKKKRWRHTAALKEKERDETNVGANK
jgi:hypothetical protein